jgi:hypothetical protein
LHVRKKKRFLLNLRVCLIDRNSKFTMPKSINLKKGVADEFFISPGMFQVLPGIGT